jgi:hypothetical protein
MAEQWRSQAELGNEKKRSQAGSLRYQKADRGISYLNLKTEN